MVDISKFKDLYISETEDQLQILNNNLLVLEKSVKNDGEEKIEKNILNDLMRASHTVKGSSATMGFNEMAYLAHVMEDVFDSARNDDLVITSDIVDEVFSAVDKLEESLESVKESESELKLKEIAEKIKNITGVNTLGAGKSDRKKSAQPNNAQNLNIENKNEAKDTKDHTEKKAAKATSSNHFPRSCRTQVTGNLSRCSYIVAPSPV